MARLSAGTLVAVPVCAGFAEEDDLHSRYGSDMKTSTPLRNEWLTGLIIWLVLPWMCREQPRGTVWIIVLLMFTLLQLMPLSRAFWDAESRQRWRFQYELPLALASGSKVPNDLGFSPILA